MNSSNISVLKTTVRGIVISASGNLLKSLLFLIILFINARPLAFPPIEPSPIRENIWYSSKLLLSNFAITPLPLPSLKLDIATYRNRLISSIVSKSSLRMYLNIWATGKSALAFSHFEKWLRVAWYSSVLSGIVSNFC